MDLVSDDQQHRLAALERVATADPVEPTGPPREPEAAGAPILRGLSSVSLLLAIILGVLWLLA
ncbi:MAG: hypothetical protein WD080_06260 [Egibacteraceae bacterium]